MSSNIGSDDEDYMSTKSTNTEDSTPASLPGNECNNASISESGKQKSL